MDLIYFRLHTLYNIDENRIGGDCMKDASRVGREDLDDLIFADCDWTVSQR